MRSSAYTEWPAPAGLAARIACLWCGHVGDAGAPYTDRVLPDACVDVIWDGARLFVAGPDTGPVPLAARPNRTFIGIRARPGHAASLLGVPADAVRDQRVDLVELWGKARADALLAAISTAADAGTVLKRLEAAVRRQMASAPQDPLVDALVARLSARGDHAPGLVERLAAELGVTQRSLHRRCTSAVGYGPKTLDRVLRFLRARSLARRHAAADLADLAAAAGYADQAHMTRECVRLAGRTPSELFKTARPERPTLRDEPFPAT